MLSASMKALLDTIVAHEVRLSVVLLNDMNDACTSGLNGFKRFFRYRSMDRSRHAIMLCNFVADYSETELSISVASPAIVAKLSLTQSLNEYHAECLGQLDRVKVACTTAVAEGELLLMSYLNMMVKDQSEELMRLKRIITQLAMPALDLRAFDKDLHCKYKYLEKEKFNFESSAVY
jgi:ferritin